jgi:hypothetical protein
MTARIASLLIVTLAIGPALRAAPGDFYHPGDVVFTSPNDAPAKCMWVAMRPPPILRPVPPAQAMCVNGKCITQTPSAEPWASICVAEKPGGAVSMTATIPEIRKVFVDAGYRQ